MIDADDVGKMAIWLGLIAIFVMAVFMWREIGGTD